MKKILVTGGEGLVGKALQKVSTELGLAGEEEAEWTFVSSQQADLLSNQETEVLFEKHRPTHVLHLAAVSGGYFNFKSANADYFRWNMIMNDNVLHTSHRFGVQKVVSCLSTSIFPADAKYPVDETALLDGAPSGDIFGYCHAKRMLAVMNAAYASQFGRQFTSVILPNLFGPHDNFSLQESHIVPGLIHRTYLAKKHGTPLEVLGSGAPLRQFVFSEDLARLLAWVLRDYDQVEPIILSPDPGSEVPISKIVELICKSMDFQGPVHYKTQVEEGQFRKTVDNSKLRRYLPHFEFVPLDESLRETVDWFQKNYALARRGGEKKEHR